jgi:F-type H+-transporting ATPase subunit b
MDMQVLRNALPEIITQLFGFLIVFWVLKTYAFGAILKSIDARRAKIEAEFRSIEDTKKALAALEADYKMRLGKIEDEARSKIQEAARKGGELARDIQQTAREEADKMIERARTEIEHDVIKAKATLREQIVDLSALMTEKVVHATVDTTAHKKLVDRFIEETGRLN